MAKKKNYYHVTDGNIASWLFGPVVFSEDTIRELRRKGATFKDAHVHPKPQPKKRKPKNK